MPSIKLVFIGRNPKNISQYSSKFWFAELKDNEVIVKFGAIGSRGTVQVKPFSTAFMARQNYEERVRKQLAEGYKPVTR
jgi:predicted DNA-binding WGR domain protein